MRGIISRCPKLQGECSMKGINIDSLSIDQLCTLEDKVRETLAARIAEKKSVLEKRLSQLARRFRRPYPRVLPKYRNPDLLSEKWSGRGKQPRWLTAASFREAA